MSELLATPGISGSVASWARAPGAVPRAALARRRKSVATFVDLVMDASLTRAPRRDGSPLRRSLPVEERPQEGGEGAEPVVPLRRVVVADRPLRGREVRRVLHRLEGVPLVPFVEGVDVDEEEAAARALQRGVRLHGQGGLERLADPLLRPPRRERAAFLARPLEAGGGGSERPRLVGAGPGRRLARLDLVVAGVDVEGEDEPRPRGA